MKGLRFGAIRPGRDLGATRPRRAGMPNFNRESGDAMKTTLSVVAAGLAVLAGGSAVQAQHWHGHGHVHGGYGHAHGIGYGGFGHAHGIGYGLGYGGYGHVHGHVHLLPSTGYYGSYWGGYPSAYSLPSYPTYSYPPVVAAPVVQPAVLTVPVAEATPSTSLRPNSLPPYTGPGVTLRLPAEFPGSVYVLIDKREVELKPGTEVVLKDKFSYRVEFDRGGEFGSSSSDITEGVYKFKVADKGWFLMPDDAATGGVRRNALPGEPKK